VTRTEAVSVVGGQGTRLRPLTLSAPKPMLPTAGVPFLTHLIARIRDAGIEHIVLGTSYRPEVFEDHFGDGSAFGVELEYVIEAEPLGTGGGIRNVAPRLRGSQAMIFNGDVLSGCDLRALLATHESTGAEVTLYLTRVPDPRAFGCVPTDASGRVTAFLEKDPNPVTDQINAGTYVFSREVLESIPAGRAVSVERETFPGLLAAGACVRRSVVGFGARLGAGSVIADAVIGDRAQVGAGCELLAGVRVWPEVCLGDGSIRFSADA
jgi:mannose-1-phosphate guanylyltransferase